MEAEVEVEVETEAEATDIFRPVEVVEVEAEAEAELAPLKLLDTTHTVFKLAEGLDTHYTAEVTSTNFHYRLEESSNVH